ncbi:MAG: T9SS type A sorting domain-containing protein [Flavobacteriales bacterium]|nr:T9SS type A sorting domain-containing protein [Flavobacteriales bacterium]
MKKIYILAIGLIATLQISAQCNGRYQTDLFSTIDVTSNVQYGSNVNLVGTTINLTMDIYTPQGDVETNRPLIILAHGGSFIGGTKNDADVVYMATELAKKGYVCASINYRLATSPFDLIAEQTTVKIVFNAIQDGKAAVRFFKQDAATSDIYKINSEQIFFGGSSAGGILAMNLAFVDTVTDLPESAPSLWQTWLTQLGGLEGNSGNPGYCSRVNGTFGFAGGVADTNFIDVDDVPWYGSHAIGDQTVLYDCGFPLSGNTPVNLCGGNPVNTRMNNLGTYHHFDSYGGSDHPPYASSASIMQDNKDSLAMFLFNILDCNPTNLQSPTQKNCTTNPNVGVDEIASSSINATIYPNPFNNDLNIELTESFDNTTIKVINSVGKVVVEQKATSYINKLSLAHLPIGMYLVIVSSNESNFVQKVIRK